MLTSKLLNMTTRLPLVVILGATGSGKTKLSLELAQKFGGEIIGADSMQVYKGLDIITAKATPEERAVAPHHLIDELDPHETFTVIDYRNRTLPIVKIDSVFAKNKLPIVVGGTNYYIESLLFKILVEEPGSARALEPGIAPNKDHELPSPELHRKLMQLDPVRATRLHPNDKRKILRSLEVFYQKGRQHSEILKEQQTSKGGSALGGGLRFEDSLILWLQCEQGVLDTRLDARVDSMLEQGLVPELLDFHKKYNEHRIQTDEVPDYTKGIFQSIGLKEFHNYLITGAQERNTEEGKTLLEKGVEELKRATRRYARKQKRWITNRFLSTANRKVPAVYGLDTTDVSLWNEKVTLPALKIVESFVENSPCALEPLPPQATQSHPNSEADTFMCDACERVFVGKYQWNIHLQSNKHKRALQWKKKQKIVE